MMQSTPSDEICGSLFDFTDDNKVEATTPKTSSRHNRLVIKSFDEAFVIANDKIIFNTSNLQDYEEVEVQVESDGVTERRKVLRRTEKGRRVHDKAAYDGAFELCETKRWVDIFHTHYRVINVPRCHLNWMRRASVVGCQRVTETGVSPLFADDIEDALQRIAVGNTFALCVRGDVSTGYFVRTDSVSLKDGIHGVGPYYGFKEMLESSITARLGHQAVEDRTESLKYYLFPWISDLHKHREFRVFVCRGRVAAISQQSLYTANSVLSPFLSDSGKDDHRIQTIISNWCQRLLPYIYDTVIPQLPWLPSFVLDIALLGPPPNGLLSVDLTQPDRLKPYFIEVNPFGFAFGSGSSLYNWCDDYEILYGGGGGAEADLPLHFRFTSPNNCETVKTEMQLQ